LRLGLEDLQIDSLGKPKYPNTNLLYSGRFVDDDCRITVFTRIDEIESYIKKNSPLPAFEAAGPREKIFFDPQSTTCGIVTCGGLCPGLNDVIRSLTLTLRIHYGVKQVLGFRYGYQGLTQKSGLEPVPLDEDDVKDIQKEGGTILGSSRGHQDPKEIVDQLKRFNVNVLFTIGGDGTLRGARDILEEIHRQSLSISIVGIPKTIDNDIEWIERSFGFLTAVEATRPSILSADEEAKGASNGVGLVKLMGRDSGFIAAYATLANNNVDFCLIPEVPFELEGKKSLLNALENILGKKRHALLVVAEGAGQHLFEKGDNVKRDASGNILHEDIGIFLKQKIEGHFKNRSKEISVKYIDPSYMIRSVPANSNDSTFCLRLAQQAAHAGMAGKTNLVVGYWNEHFVHIPIEVAIRQRRKINPKRRLWQSVLAVTGQTKWLNA